MRRGLILIALAFVVGGCVEPEMADDHSRLTLVATDAEVYNVSIWRDEKTECEFLVQSHGGVALIPGTCDEVEFER